MYLPIHNPTAMEPDNPIKFIHPASFCKAYILKKVSSKLTLLMITMNQNNTVRQRLNMFQGFASNDISESNTFFLKLNPVSIPARFRTGSKLYQKMTSSYHKIPSVTHKQ